LKTKKRIEENLIIDAIGFEGKSIARNEGVVHFVKKGVPGDVVRTLRVNKKKKFYENVILEFIEKSPDRIEAKCKHFENCGGCSWQNLNYDHQLKWKKVHVEDAFFRHNKLEVGKIYDTIPSEKIFNYRNKMEFSFGASRWLTEEEIETDAVVEHKNFALGLHIAGRFDKILDLDICHIQGEIGNDILNACKDLALKMGVTAFSQRFHNGFLRSLIIRKSNYLNEYMVVLITSQVESEIEKEFITNFKVELEKIKEVSNYIHSINTSKNPVTIDSSEILFGEGILKEQILDIIYEISPYSFFQTNSYQVNTFISEILEAVDPKEDDYIWDLYCGTGSITLPLSRKVNNLLGIELVDSSIKDAKSNAEKNGIDNIEFIAYDLHSKDISNLLSQYNKPDKIVLDPPRAGLHKNLIAHLLEIQCEEIIYVSCNPMTQARDCKDLEEFYTIEYIKPLDMFPQTYHIESIAKLRLIKKIS